MGAEVRLAIAGSFLAYAVEATAGTKPASGFTMVPEVTSIPELASADRDMIDMTPVNETVEHKEVAGLRNAPGVLNFEANLSDTLLEFWNTTLMGAYNTASAAGKKMYFAVIINGMDKCYMFPAKPEVLVPAGGDVSNGWKCSLPITPTETPTWEDKPTVTSTVNG